MKRICVKNENGKMTFFPCEKEIAEKNKITHLTVFNIIAIENKFLLFRLSKKNEFKGMWTFIAGHVDSMEEAKNPYIAAKRETEEETSIRLKEDEIFVVQGRKLLPLGGYKIRFEDLLDESEISKEYGFDLSVPHLVLPFASILKEMPKIKLSEEFDKFELASPEQIDNYRLTPVSRFLHDEFIKQRKTSN